jgi:hypothetical protein
MAMINLWRKYILGWKSPPKDIRCAFVTPMFVNKDHSAVKRQCKQLAKAGYNSVMALVDLQDGRPYIFRGRTATKLDSKTEKNLKIVLGAGLTPVIIIRNDWASRTKQKYIPSAGGQSLGADFYSGQRLQSEKLFIQSLKWLYPYSIMQLNLEPDRPEAAGFAVSLAELFRKLGFKHDLLVNPYLAAQAHERLRGELQRHKVKWANSYNGEAVPPHDWWNTDGNLKLTDATAPEWIARMRRSGKPWAIWSMTLAHIGSKEIPQSYLKGVK